jgi:small subunit ribosomal protein S1
MKRIMAGTLVVWGACFGLPGTVLSLGLSTPFGLVTVENLQPGETYNTRELVNLPLSITNKSVTAVTDFGAFVRFDENLEGLVHISEIAWQRIDHPRDVLKVGDHVAAEIINIEGSKIFLSMKKLVEDPWKSVAAKYKLNQWVKGRVLKINPFGLFVELDPDIHGLAHISELGQKPVKDVNEVARVGDEFEFRIISIEPENHRLGLSLRKPKEEVKEKA